MIADVPGGAVIHIKVIPRAGRTTLAGTRDDLLLIRLAAAPVEGAANAALIELLSDVFGYPKRSFTVIAGEKSRTKTVKVTGATAAQLRARLAAERQ